MSWVKRVAGSRPVQQAAEVAAAEYLRLVWNTTGFKLEAATKRAYAIADRQQGA